MMKPVSCGPINRQEMRAVKLKDYRCLVTILTSGAALLKALINLRLPFQMKRKLTKNADTRASPSMLGTEFR